MSIPLYLTFVFVTFARCGYYSDSMLLLILLSKKESQVSDKQRVAVIVGAKVLCPSGEDVSFYRARPCQAVPDCGHAEAQGQCCQLFSSHKCDI